MKSAPLLFTVCSLVLVLTASVWADRVAVTLNDGSTTEGELVAQTDERVVLRVGSDTRSFDMADVKSVEPAASLSVRFAEQRKKIDDSDYDARYDLAREMFATETIEGYRLAKLELESILEDNPKHADSKLTLPVVRTALRDAQKRPVPGDQDKAQPDGTAKPDQPGTADKVKPGELPLLARGQMASIAVFENPQRVVVPRDTRTEMLKKHRNNPFMARFIGRDGERRLYTASDAELLEILLNINDRQLLKQVVIRRDPKSLMQFKAFNRNFIGQYFAKYFGKGEQGLWLHESRGKPNEAAYTNFLNLHRATHDEMRFIDRDAPHLSLLVQWSLPRDAAKHPAPEVKGWRPYFSGTNDPRYKQMINWIQSLNNTVDPSTAVKDYPVQFSPAPVKPEPKDADTKPEATPATTGEMETTTPAARG